MLVEIKSIKNKRIEIVHFSEFLEILNARQSKF